MSRHRLPHSDRPATRYRLQGATGSHDACDVYGPTAVDVLLKRVLLNTRRLAEVGEIINWVSLGIVFLRFQMKTQHVHHTTSPSARWSHHHRNGSYKDLYNYRYKVSCPKPEDRNGKTSTSVTVAHLILRLEKCTPSIVKKNVCLLNKNHIIKYNKRNKEHTNNDVLKH